MKFKRLLATALMSIVISTAVFANDVSVSINGEIVDFPNQQPTIVDGRTLIPLRGVFDKLGYSIDWDNDTKTVTLEKDSSRISIQIGEKTIYIDGSPMEIDVPAQLINGSTMLPMRAITDASGTQLLWDNDNKIATIIAPNLAGTSLSGTAQPTSEEENTYLTGYVAAYESYNPAASEFLELAANINNLDPTSDTDIAYALTTLDNLCTAAQSTIDELNKLTPPSNYSALHNKTIEYMQAMIDLGTLYNDLFTGNYNSDAELETRMNEVGTRGAIAEAEFKELFAQTFK